MRITREGDEDNSLDFVWRDQSKLLYMISCQMDLWIKSYSQKKIRTLWVGKRCLDKIYFPSWIYDRLDQGEDMKLGDVSDDEKAMVRKMVITAFWCIQLQPADRPSMNKVLKMLESEVELLEMPPKPFHQLALDTPSEIHGCESSSNESSATKDATTITGSNVV